MATGSEHSRRQSVEARRLSGHAANPVIDESWDRCRPVVDQARSAAPVDAEPDEVRERWAASPIRRSGIDVAEQLGRAAEASGMIAAVTDADGRILWTAGSRRMRGAAEAVGFIPGGRWDEQSAGTNALGLALHTGQPAAVFSSEHWCESVQDWSCWSVPVSAPNGRRLGVLDLSGRWDSSSPIVELAVTSLGRLVEEHLPDDVGLKVGAGGSAGEPELRLRLLGHPEVTLDGRALALTPRQGELLAALALEGPCDLDQLQQHVYGDRVLSRATIKAEISHLRRILGGGIESRPYRLTLPVRVDAIDLRRNLARGDVSSALDSYAGQLLPDSESPFAIDHRHLIDATLRRLLLEGGAPAELLRFADVHRFDEAVLERAIAICGHDDPLRHEARARLELAQRG